MMCSCGQYIQSSYAFCPKCGTKVVGPYASPVGTWHVTTEGDCEGKSTKDLGIHTGHVADIARVLGNHCFYSLQFEQVLISETVPEPEKECKSVNIKLGIDSGTWNSEIGERARWMKTFLGKNSTKTPFTVHPGTYFSSVVLKY
jgi:hypothetical protein